MTAGSYDQILDEMSTNNGDITPKLETQLKIDVFRETAQYDTAIVQFLAGYPKLYEEYQAAKNAIIAGEREPFKCWTEKH